MIDGIGHQESESNRISDAWFGYGCVSNWAGGSYLPTGGAINQNAFHEAARRMHRWVRILSHHVLTGYEVIAEAGGDQKSVLWFTRTHPYSEAADPWDGIADCIVHDAPVRGWTNEWMFGVWLKPWSPNDGSIWKQSAFSEYYSVFNRCMWQAPEIGNDPDWLWQVSYGAKVSGANYLSEAPSGYNYGRLMDSDPPEWINQQECWDSDCEEARLKFIKGCRIYEPDIEIEKAETVTIANVSYLRVQLYERLRSTYGETDGAPATVSRNMTGWVRETIQSEPFRTPENALRLWLLARDKADYGKDLQAGDRALKGNVPDAFPSIVPSFYFVKLIPIPYDDGNDVQSDNDTPLYADAFSQMDFMLRSWASGFVDAGSTIGLNNCAVADPTCYEDPQLCRCSENGYDLYDYTYQNLCMEAFGLPWVGCMPTVATRNIEDDDIRLDNPFGFGPLPNTIISSEVFNRYCSAVNLLDKARVMLPYKVETNSVLYYSTNTIFPPDPDFPPDPSFTLCGSSNSCGGGSPGDTFQAMILTPTPATTWYSETGWMEDTFAYAYTQAAFDCSGGNFYLNAARQTVSVRFALVHPDYLNAIPLDWKPLFEGTGSKTLWCKHTHNYTIQSTTGATECYSGGPAWTCKFGYNTITATTGCEFIGQETIDLGTQVPGGWNVVCNRTVGGSYYHLGLSPGSFVWMTPMPGRSLYVQIPVETPT